MDYLVCHKRNYGNFPETEDTISETTIDLAGLEQAVLHFYNHDSYLAAHDWIEIHPILHGLPHQAVPIPPARYRSQVASSAEMQKGQNVINRLTNQLDMLKTDRAFLAIDRGDLWALQRALSASVSQHREATRTGEKINGVPVSELKELDQEIAARSGGAPMRQSQPGRIHVFKPGDSLYLIAHRYHMTLPELYEANKDQWPTPSPRHNGEELVGLELRIPDQDREAPATGDKINDVAVSELKAIDLAMGVTPIPAHIADQGAALLAKLDEQAENYGELRMVQLSDADVQTLRAAIPFTYRKKEAATDAS